MKSSIIYAVIISYKSYHELKNNLSSISNLVVPKKCKLNLIVVDCGTEVERLRKIKEIYPHVKFISKRGNLGVGKSFNLGIDYALKNSADYLLLLTADIFVNRDFLTKTYSKLNTSNKTGIVSGKLLFDTNPPKILFINGKLDKKVRSTIHIGMGEIDKGQYDHRSETEILNCPILLKREVIEKVGKFREDYFMYYEDTDFYYRARQKGYSLAVNPSARAFTDYPDINTNSISLMRKHYYNSKNLLYFIKNNFDIQQQIIAYIYIFKNNAGLIKNVFERDSRAESYYKLLGVKDFLTGKRGYRKIQ